MKRWVLRVSVVLCALVVVLTVCWLLWRNYLAPGLLLSSIAFGNTKRLNRLIYYGADIEKIIQYSFEAADGHIVHVNPGEGVLETEAIRRFRRCTQSNKKSHRGDKTTKP